MPIEKTIDDMFVITISFKEEYEKLKEVCKKRDISYPNNFFKDDYQNHIYGVTPYSIGYVGTSIAMHVKEDHVVHTVDELIKGLDKLDIQ